MENIRQFIRFALFLLNGLSLLLGGFLIFQDSPLITFPMKESVATCFILTSTIVVVSFIGCFAVALDSFCMTTTYAILMSLLLMGQLVFRHKLMEIVKDSIWKQGFLDKEELVNCCIIATVVEYIMLILSCYLCHSDIIKMPRRQPSVPIYVH